MLGTMNKSKNKRLLVTERGESERSGDEPNAVTNNADENSPPNPEVRPKTKKRRFTAAYKAKIVEEAMACTEKGQIGSLLRREGLYASYLTQWKNEYKSGALKGLKGIKRGRKQTKDPREKEVQKLQNEVTRLNKQLEKANLIIDIQKKVAALLGNPIETPEENS